MFIKSDESINEKPYGLMFHHFYDEKHSKGQGAISADQLESIIEYYGDDLLSAEEWYNKAITKTLSSNDICLTFDDALLCQYEIALPVLEKYNLTAFWFVYSSVLDGGLENLEVYRKFRTKYFAKIDDFYDRFFLAVKDSIYNGDVEMAMNYYSHASWKHFPFYSRNDTKFRYIRDTVLGPQKYNQLMHTIMSDFNINMAEFTSDLWMKSEHVREIHNKGHVVGLHSHTHPTAIAKLSVVEQEKEYQTNFEYLCSILDENPKVVSHPCNSYSKETLSILRKLGVELGFRSNMENHMFSMYEYPRDDHANILTRIEQNDSCVHN